MFRDPPGPVAQVTQIIEIKACLGLVKASEDSELLNLLKLLKLQHGGLITASLDPPRHWEMESCSSCSNHLNYGMFWTSQARALGVFYEGVAQVTQNTTITACPDSSMSWLIENCTH
jgi:hypothetical protein